MSLVQIAQTVEAILRQAEGEWGLTRTRVLVTVVVLVLYPVLVGVLATWRSGNNPRVAWTRMRRYPLGTWLYHRFLYNWSPFSGRAGVSLAEFSEQRVVVTVGDSKGTRNFYRMPSQGLLATLIETAATLRVVSQLTGNARAVPQGLHVEQLARPVGQLRAMCDYAVKTGVQVNFDNVPVVVVNADTGEVVVKAFMRFAFR